MLLWPCKCSQQIWVADCDCISFLEQHFVLTGGSRCLSSPLSWLLISHPQLCSSSPSNYPWAPFSSVSPVLRPPASGSSLSSVGFLPTVLSSHCALLCPESHVSLFLHLFLHFATAHVQVTWQERVCGRLRCWVLTYQKLYALTPDWEFDWLWNSRLKHFPSSLGRLILVGFLFLWQSINSMYITVICSPPPRPEDVNVSSSSLAHSIPSCTQWNFSI